MIEYHIILYNITLYHIKLHYISLHYIVSYYIKLHYIISYNIILYYILLSYVIIWFHNICELTDVEDFTLSPKGSIAVFLSLSISLSLPLSPPRNPLNIDPNKSLIADVTESSSTPFEFLFFISLLSLLLSLSNNGVT